MSNAHSRARRDDRRHATGCRVNGGPGVPPGTCPKCSDNSGNQYFRALSRIDRRAG